MPAATAEPVDRAAPGGPRDQVSCELRDAEHEHEVEQQLQRGHLVLDRVAEDPVRTAVFGQARGR